MAAGDAGPANVNSIRSAVERFAVSLDRSEEALLHTSQVKDLSDEMFVLYRLTFGDSGAPAAETASAAMDEASGQAELVLGLLDRAKGAIRDYVAMVAPEISLTDSVKIRNSPSGEELLEPVRRVRNARRVANLTVQEAENISSLLQEGHKTIGFFDPPDPSGIVASAPIQSPSARVAPSQSGSDGLGDPVLTVVVATVLIIKAAQATGSRIWAKITGRKKS
jgi:hypothetical protein